MFDVDGNQGSTYFVRLSAQWSVNPSSYPTMLDFEITVTQRFHLMDFAIGIAAVVFWVMFAVGILGG